MFRRRENPVLKIFAIMHKSCVIVQKPECTYIFTFSHAISNYSHCHFGKRIQADMCGEHRLSSSFKAVSNNLQDRRSKAFSSTEKF